MLTRDQSHHFAQQWIKSWNARDLDAVLAHYDDDFEMESPFIASIAGQPSGVLRGKDAVREYWTQALRKFPDLSFVLLGVHIGARSIAVRYRSVLGLIAVETLSFGASGKVTRAVANYNELDTAKAAGDQTWFFASHLTPILNVSDIPATLEWFGKLGWRACWTWSADGSGPPTFGAVGAGQGEIFLCLNGQGGRGKGPNRSTSGGDGEDDTVDKGVWMSVWVPDVDAVHKRCIEHGLDVTHPPTDEPWGVREMHVRHPDGHVLRISRGHE